MTDDFGDLSADSRRLVLAAAARRLAHTDTPELDARILLAHVLGLEPQGLLFISIVPEEHLAAFDVLVERRAAGEPVGRILGRRGFWTLELGLNEATLEPRPDSETLIEAALPHLPVDRPLKLLDLGTGSGCLLLALLAERPLAEGLGIDAAPRAVEQAQYNAFDNGLSQRAEFRVGHWAKGLTGPFDLIISNPPYIPTGILADLMPEVRDHDPSAALDGGADGLDCYREIAETVGAVLAPGGTLVLELGEGQAADVTAIFTGFDWRLIDQRADLGGVLRCLVFTR